MSEPIKITVTTSVWLYGGTNSSPHDLVAALQRGDTKAITRMLHYYGGPEMEKFGEYTKVGTADMTISFLPQDEQVRLAVAALNDKLIKARAEFMQFQAGIMEQINKLQAITYEPEAA